jgi:hypothetical protein
VIVARSVVSPVRLASLTQSPSRMPRTSASCGWISSRSSSCQTTFAVRRVCAPTLYWLRMRPVVSSSGKRGPVRSSVGTYSVRMNLPLPRTKPSMCMTGVPSGRLVAGPLDRAHFVELLVADAGEGRRQRAISSMISEGWV